LYGCEIYLALREEYSLNVDRIFVPKRREVAWGWRKQDNAGLNDNSHHSPNIIKMIKSKLTWQEIQHARERGEMYADFC
jgi:hypothetical protein